MSKAHESRIAVVHATHFELPDVAFTYFMMTSKEKHSRTSLIRKCCVESWL